MTTRWRCALVVHVVLALSVCARDKVKRNIDDNEDPFFHLTKDDIQTCASIGQPGDYVDDGIKGNQPFIPLDGQGKEDYDRYDGLEKEDYDHVQDALRQILNLTRPENGTGSKESEAGAEGTDSLPGSLQGEETPETPECSVKLSRGDVDQLLEGLLGEGGRRRRGATRLDESSKWDSTTPIMYAIDTTEFSNFEMRMIRKAFSIWQENTCLQFEEVEASVIKAPGIIIRDSNNDLGCSSYVGRLRTKGNAQPIELSSPGCLVFIGTSLHEIGHTLGLEHEHQRPDRDEYIKISMNSIDYSRRWLFETIDSIDTRGMPYDLSSVMHYGRKSFSLLGRNTLEARDKEASLNANLGQTSQLSFLDVKTVNMAYCSEVCSESSNSCLNEGYPNPLNCSECKCPPGYTGQNCQHFNRGSTGCVPGSGEITLVGSEVRCMQSPHLIYSLGDMYCYGRYKYGDECSWKITAPEGARIQMWFPHDANEMTSHLDGSCLNWLDLRYLGGRHAVNGHRLCEGWLFRRHGDVDSALESTENEVLVLFQSPDPMASSPKTGFRMCTRIDPIYFSSDVSNSTTTSSKSTTTTTTTTTTTLPPTTTLKPVTTTKTCRWRKRKRRRRRCRQNG